MGLHYITFMGRNLENRIQPNTVRIMNSAGMISKNFANSVGIFSNSDAMNGIFNQ
jgi:hypothetical protein